MELPDGRRIRVGRDVSFHTKRCGSTLTIVLRNDGEDFDLGPNVRLRDGGEVTAEDLAVFQRRNELAFLMDADPASLW